MRVASKMMLVLAAAGAVIAAVGPVLADDDKKPKTHKRGGYSVTSADTINTYGNLRTKYSSADVYRDPRLDTQTRGGPFDHDFFFDSGIGRNGGNSPYQN